ncbi:DNA helicase MCM9 [Plutella xylostella]|uniref:DNA helicase MCM9 n=1 Tax=Plutella xylostella TaxID=51655 RepID=UPI0020326DAA|nr:DNA helicase MCM9 [Plutella xylostella]
MILDYVLKFHLQDCLDILGSIDTLGYYSVKIDFMKLFETYPDIGDKILCNPVETLVLCKEDLMKAQETVIERHGMKISEMSHCTVKLNIQARFFGLPVCPELHRTIFPKNVDLGCFLKVTGTIVRVTQAKMLEYKRTYVCVKCKHKNIIEADFDHRYVLKAPTKCVNEEKKCKCTTFTQVNMVSREHCKDYQEIKIQEQINKLNVGAIPGSIWVVLEDDLVDTCKPGDDVHICGIVRRRWRPSVLSKKCEVELVLQANYLEVCNSQQSKVIASAPDVKDCFDEYWTKFEACPLKGRDQILASVCPQVYGLHLVKLALLLTVITGSNHIADSEAEKKAGDDDDYGSRVRGQCHLLLVGDPGTGKSQLLRAGVDLTPRSVFTSGAGTTRAGLTCAALREDGEWQLEAGALVLSDGGVCCIDEVGQLREHDRAAVHEAMEQQTISIAKAGIVCKLNTRCAVIAACNPKGHYQTDEPLSANVSLGTPLLSRFDLIFILLDTKNKNWDKLVTSYILFGGSHNSESKKQWSIEKLQMYIGLVGPRCMQMTKSANIILQTYYMTQRKSDYRDPSRTTVRMLDSLVRLSQAHCRLMYRTTILPMDAIVAVSLVDLSMQDCTLHDTVDALHSTTPQYPDFDYLCTAKKLLAKLNLYEIWKEELLYFAKLLKVDVRTLETDIDNERNLLFTKFEDVSVDNIPLSSTLITSSYFNGKKNGKTTDDNDKDDFVDENEIAKKQIPHVEDKNEMTKKLAVTLKKMASLNKEEKVPPIKQKTKRKRKTVTVDSDSLSKKTKTAKNKPKRNTNKIEDKSHSCDDSDENDHTINLNAVPSVNDVFNELGIDFNFEPSPDSKPDTEIHDKSRLNETMKENIKEDNEVIKKENIDSNSDRNTSSTLSKLKQFQFAGKHDLSKYDEVKIKEEAVTRLENVTKSIAGSSTDSINKKTSLPSSQISMFESSDCDIDLDL